MGEYIPSSPSNCTYTVLEKPLGSTRPIRIVTIGAGASGINMIKALRDSLTDYEHVVYEKNPEVGGTWYENRYPGCTCDIPSHNYQFSWKQNPSWSSFYAPAPEIEEYLCKVCEDENLWPYIKLLHSVEYAHWNEGRGVWELKIRDLNNHEVIDDYCNFLLDATGILNAWKWPDIKGLHEFTGELIHTADWPEGFIPTGKRVAVIGNGSSGVQIVPTLQPKVKSLVQFVRSPTWMVPAQERGKIPEILSSLEMDGFKFTPNQIEKFKASPEYYLKFVKAVEVEINSKFPILIKDSEIAAYTKKALTNYMSKALKGNNHLIKTLVPTFPVGCRRLTPAVGYLESLSETNVRVVSDKIIRILPNGIETNTGEVIEVDTLICATGFDVSFCPRFPIIGKNGNLQDIWRAGSVPRAYMSCAVPGFPNLFRFLGPNAPIGHGSVLTIVEHMAKYIINIIHKCQTERIVSISPTEIATSDFYEHVEAFMPRTAWAGKCRSWFKNGEEIGPVTALHPGSRIHWFHMLERFRGEDFEYRYVEGKRFGYLGNGFSTKELGEGDKTWYLGAVKEEISVQARIGNEG